VRLQLIPPTPLIVTIALASLGGLDARAEEVSGEGSARLDVYSDGVIEVIAPAGSVAAQVGESLSAEAGYMVNVVSGATPLLTADAISSATQFSDTRHAGDIAVTQRLFQDFTLRPSLSTSYEADYFSNGGGLTLGADLLESMITVTAGYHGRVDVLTLATGEPLTAWNHGHRVDLTWTQILTRSTRINVLVMGDAAFCDPMIGCDASPYRYVPLVDGGDVLLAVRERHPAERLRLAAGARGSQALGSGAALHGGYRYYIDTWGVQAHTADASVAIALFDERLMLRTGGRAMWQSAAFFYEDAYVKAPGAVAVPRWRTSDRELSGLIDVMASVRAGWSFFDVGPLRRVTPNARAACLLYFYPQFSELPRRHGCLVGGGVDVEL
jgi:hypothetical protein